MKKKWVAMLLAGGQGSRLGALTHYIAKPAVAFAGKYRIIDFSLSNCVYSNIDTVGVLTQYKPLLLNAYIGTGKAWDLDEASGGVHILPPFVSEEGGSWYKGTASAIFQNIDFIDNYDPDYVLIISGDHIYKMDYGRMLAFHEEKQAEVTISVMKVPWEEASRFGLVIADEDKRITGFEEKPPKPQSDLASMGIYIFNWSLLKKALLIDEQDKTSENDFGKNVIPALLKQDRRLYAYPFEGYWRDVGTIESYYEANMELLEKDPSFDISERGVRILSNSNIFPPHYVGPQARITSSLVCNGCSVFGEVTHSVLSPNVSIAEGARVSDCILLPGAKIQQNAWLRKVIVGENTVIERDCSLGIKTGPHPRQGGITVVADHVTVAAESLVEEGKNIFRYKIG